MEPCAGSPPLDATPTAAGASATERIAACAAASAAASANGTSGAPTELAVGSRGGAGLIGRFKAHLEARAPPSALLCKYSDSVGRPEGDPRAAGGKVPCAFRQRVVGDVRWTGVFFLRAQHAGVDALMPMHAAMRAYHTTRGDLSDDDPRWRDLRRPCNIEVQPRLSRQ